MIKIYKSLNDGTLERLEKIEKNCWIDLVSPSLEEIDEVANITEVEKDLMLKMLDEEEIPRIEVEDNSIALPNMNGMNIWNLTESFSRTLSGWSQPTAWRKMSRLRLFFTGEGSPRWIRACRICWKN